MPTVESHGINIYFESHGTGPETIIFAHGMGGNAAIWFNQVAHFSERFQVVTFDHRYFARSTCLVDEFNPAYFPDDALAIMDHLSIENAIFVCQSMGGWTGSQLAISQPERVNALVMSHTPGVFEHESAINDRRAVTNLVSKPATIFESPALAADFPQKNFRGAVLYQQISSFNGIDPSVIPKKIGEAEIGVNVDTLTDYSIPTLFITADKDILFPPDYIESLSRVVPGGKFKNLGDAGHSSYFEIPEVFNRTVDEFIEDI